MIYYDNESGFWRWDRWCYGSGTRIEEWLVRYWLRTGKETVINDDIWRVDSGDEL